MANHVFVPVRGKRLRITQLDNCGRVPAAGTPEALITSSGFVSVKLSTVTEDGTEIIKKNADGALCVNEKFADSFKRFTVEIEFCGVNPALISKVSNAKTYRDASGDINGFTVAEGDIEKWFALELWTGLSGQACKEGEESAGGYMLLPFVQGGVMGDLTVDGENDVSFSLTGAYTKGQNQWGVGPYQVAYNGSGTPSFLPHGLDPLDHLLMMDTGLAAPPAADDPQPMVSNGTSTTTSTTTRATTTV